MKKAGTSGTTVKSGNIGKITSKSGSANVGKTSKSSSNSPSLGKLPNVPKPSTKSYELSSYKPQKNKSTFGIIWLPTKKRNKYKDEVYNSHKFDRSHERAPSMYNNLISGAMDPLDKKSGESSQQEALPDRSATVPITIAGGAAVAEFPDIDANQEELEALKHDREESKVPEHSSGFFEQYFLAVDLDNMVVAGQADMNKCTTTNQTVHRMIAWPLSQLEAGGDAHSVSRNTDTDYIENNEKEKDKSTKSEKEKGDDVDSVFLRPPPPHKVSSNSSNSTTKEEDCGITCLYFTMQCCECNIV